MDFHVKGGLGGGHWGMEWPSVGEGGRGGILKAMLGQEGNQGAMMRVYSIIGLMLCQEEVNVIYTWFKIVWPSNPSSLFEKLS